MRCVMLLRSMCFVRYKRCRERRITVLLRPSAGGAAVLMAAIGSAHDGGSQKKRAPGGMPGARSFAVLMPPYCGGAAR